ncbi:Hsp20/alpha crystallin family protein [Qipengyuania thermophila]|uniref:Hsp20/alpha crystallin family protein n=1 Tax=Qipengyuania thermophila TaxID=2509361 RepID=UPI0013EAFAAA|nr:Hsp20/alpha crystallin family protein [Qipengyuania thermophila]
MAFRYLAPFGTGSSRGLTGSGGGSIFDLHRQMNQLFDNLLDGGQSGGASAMAQPLMDVHQENGRVEITAELPGVKEEDIDIHVEDGVLILTGEKKAQRENSETGYRERSYGRFERRITLPNTIDEDKIEADFEHGVLTITLPLAERQTGRKIKLGSSRQQSGKDGGSIAGSAGSDAENALIDQDSSRVGGPGGEGGEHHTPGMEQAGESRG